MDVEAVRARCLGLPAATEDMPFGPDVLAFRIGGKIFALINIERIPISINLKCDPERAVELREEYDAITPGYHMNKKHWNTVDLSGGVPWARIRELIDHSYHIVRASLPRNVRSGLDGQ